MNEKSSNNCQLIQLVSLVQDSKIAPRSPIGNTCVVGRFQDLAEQFPNVDENLSEHGTPHFHESLKSEYRPMQSTCQQSWLGSRGFRRKGNFIVREASFLQPKLVVAMQPFSTREAAPVRRLAIPPAAPLLPLLRTGTGPHTSTAGNKNVAAIPE